jgi:hypothetical protein
MFRAMVALDPNCDSAVDAHLSGTRTHRVIELYRRKYFPALLSCEGQPPLGGPNILMRIVLTDTEADVFFARSQRFTVWADAIVGETIRGEGLVGYGVISCQEPPPLPSVNDRAAHRARTDPASPSAS